MERLTSPNINVDPDTDRFLHAAIGGKEIDWKQNRDSTLNVLINGPTSNGFGKDIFRKMVRDLYGRLKAYEDIAELCGGLDRLRELAEADKDGRIRIIPESQNETCGHCYNFEREPGTKHGTCAKRPHPRDRYGKIDCSKQFIVSQSTQSCRLYMSLRSEAERAMEGRKDG